MSSGFARAGANANLPTVKVAYAITRDCGLVERIVVVAQALWPRKTAAELAVCSDVSPRTCERWIGERTGLSADALAALIRSDDGLRFLEAIIGDARPAWWKKFRSQVERAEIRQRIEQQRRRLDALDSSDD